MFDEDSRTRQEIKRLSKQVKKMPLLFARLGQCYFRLADLDHAEPILKRGVEEHPDYAAGLLVLGEVYLYKGFLRDAEEVAAQGLARHPDHLGLLQLMLRVQKGLAEENEVHRLRSRLKELDPLHVSEDLEEAAAQAFAEEEPGEEPPAVMPSPAAMWKIRAAARQQREAEAEEPPAEEAETPPKLEELLGEATEPGPESAGTEFPGLEEEPAKPKKVGIFTKTMAELYAKQNQFDAAIEIYEELLARNPGNEKYSRRLEELKTLRDTLAASQEDQ